MDIAALTMLIFGVLITGMGMTGVLMPHVLLSILGLSEAGMSSHTAQIFVMASAQASIAMGLYYIFAATNNVRVFFQWSVPLRIINFLVFVSMVPLGIAPIKWLMVAGLELVGAMATGIALGANHNYTFSTFNILRIASVVLAAMGAIVAFLPLGIYGSASVFLLTLTFGFIHAYRQVPQGPE